jgi:hypothetical protein
VSHYGLLSIREIIQIILHPQQAEEEEEKQMKDQLEALVAQMHGSGILYFEAKKWVMLMDWNDHPQRRFPSIERAFRQAIRLAKKEEKRRTHNEQQR